MVGTKGENYYGKPKEGSRKSGKTKTVGKKKVWEEKRREIGSRRVKRRKVRKSGNIVTHSELSFNDELERGRVTTWERGEGRERPRWEGGKAQGIKSLPLAGGGEEKWGEGT